MNLSHRLRLAWVATSVTGFVLGALFVAIVFFAHKDVLGDKRTEIGFGDAKLHTAGETPSSILPSSTRPTRNSRRPCTARTVGARGRLVVSDRNGLRGFVVREGWMEYGRPFKGQDVTLALDLREAERGLDRLALALAAIWLPLTLLVGATTWATAQSVFRPLDRLSAQALAIGGADLSERLVTPDRAEFGAFAGRLNEMLDRIARTVERGERFSTDAAHELRTPLAILRTRLETALIQPRSPEEYERTIRRSIQEIARLTSITESLLRSSRGEHDPAPAIDLRPFAEEAVERWAERYAAASVGLQSTTEAASAALLADEARILLDNLLDNALRYAPAGSSVALRLAEEDREVRLSVRDEGPGVPPEIGERIFDRFVRADDSRNRASGGAGIGLAVCRQIVESRDGRMTLASGPDGADVGCAFPLHACDLP